MYLDTRDLAGWPAVVTDGAFGGGLTKQPLAYDSLRKLAHDARDLFGESVQGGKAQYNAGQDSKISSLDSFSDAVITIRSLPGILEYISEDHMATVALQFVYDSLERAVDQSIDDAVDQAWKEFEQESRCSQWRYLSACYLQNFFSVESRIELASEITIHHRNSYNLRTEGWSEFQVKHFHDEWRGEQHLLIVEERVAKRPENFLIGGTGTHYPTTLRSLRALRLAKEGDVHIAGERMLRKIQTTRPVGAGFPPSAGIAMHGTTVRCLGDAYSLTAQDIEHVRHVYAQVCRLDELSAPFPHPLDLALQFFESSYDRVPARDDVKVVDLIAAAEALLGSTQDSTFRLAFRIARLLGRDDEERTATFDAIRGFYDARSKVVHGAKLKSKQEECASNYPALRNRVRELILGFIHLALDSRTDYPESYFSGGSLDSNLLSDAKTRALQHAMNLTKDL